MADRLPPDQRIGGFHEAVGWKVLELIVFEYHLATPGSRDL
jgi:hypothetical protein